MALQAVHVRTTRDGREITVADGWLCLDGQPEVRELTALDEHPNRQAILKAVPQATHVGGRLALTLPEASVAQAALRRQQDRFDGSPHAVAERLRQTVWRKAVSEGAD